MPSSAPPPYQQLAARAAAPIALLPLLLAGLVASGLYALYWTPYAIDDSWITYRYAEHLGSGQGFVYNPGEKVLGTSTPLYTLLLAGAHAVGLPIPVVSYAIGWAAMLGTLLGVYLLTRRLHSELAALLAIAFVTMSPYFHRVATYGMETPLYTCMIVFAFYAYAIGRHMTGTVLAALCLLTRLDGAAVGAALFLTYLIEHRRVPWTQIAVYLSLSVPWFVFAQLYFGAALPNSFIAKRQHTASPLQGWLLRWLLLRSYTLPAALGWLVVLFNSGSRAPAMPMALWSVAYVVAYTFSSLWRYEWYFTPLTVPLGVFGAIGVVSASQWLARSPQKRRLAVVVLAVLLLAPDLYATARQLQQGRYVNLIERARYEAAIWMSANLPKDAVISTGGIGIVGYLTGNYILDSAGLVSPQVLGEMHFSGFFQATAVERFHPKYFLLSQPDMPEYMVKEYVFIKSWQTGHANVPLFRLACLQPCGPAEE